MAVTQSTRNELIVSALCKNLNISSEKFLNEASQNDVKNLYLSISKASGKEVEITDEVSKWLEFADNFSASDLSRLNEELVQKSVLLGGLKASEIDVLVFAATHSSVVALSKSERENLPHVLRWMDYIQVEKEFDGLFDEIVLKKPEFEPSVTNASANAKANADGKKTEQSTSNANKSKADAKKTDAGKKAGKDKEAPQEKKKSSEAEVEKDKEVSVTLLNIKVGQIRKAWKHPSADSLLVEEIDVGEGKLRQVVSGLAKYCSPESLTDRCVALITNVKPGKLRDVMSEGLVLCASSEDHTIVEPLLPPQGAEIGERILFSGFDGKPEDVLNPKKKQLDKITPHLFTDDKGVATYKGIPFMTSGGPCTSSITKGTIK
ncbi:uncharacterized protein [Rutidosis leptorrhynchoides]|uniref:uncharacterized protein n=1 Tax=Rutidosis leptorrhynchoides TaxID=125765 RepID=UPI003A9A3A8E